MHALRPILIRCAMGGAALAAAGAATGCGTSGDREQARAAAVRFLDAYARHDGARACAQLSPSLREQLVKDQPGEECPRAVLTLQVHPGRVTSVRVYATSAVAEVDNGETMFLGSGGTGWRLDAVGCHRRDPGPLDCEEAV